ncbi:MAG TPA: helix-turn-helix domain-containing protein [Segeticoccus sp.]|nr:helix-turn-helix domain-containing protein [Segeticoccus sp.]
MADQQRQRGQGRRGRGRTLRLEDPRAIRALAHPARQRVIEELFNGEVLTATEAARICGLTPSAMSYHLRALEKWGIVTRGDVSGDGRERPWRAAADHLSIGPQAHAKAPSGAGRAFLASYLQSLHRAVDAWSDGGPDLEGSGQLVRGRLWLSDAEAAALNEEIAAVIERYDTRTAADGEGADREGADREGADGEGALTARDYFWMQLPRHR